MKGTNDTITLKAALDWMDTGASFSIAFVTSDAERGTGGEWIEVKEARKHDWLNKKEKAKLEKVQPQSDRVRKDPHHYENSTRNIILPNGDIRKISIRLIRRFNDKTVM